jgi:hypothetical protein
MRIGLMAAVVTASCVAGVGADELCRTRTLAGSKNAVAGRRVSFSGWTVPPRISHYLRMDRCRWRRGDRRWVFRNCLSRRSSCSRVRGRGRSLGRFEHWRGLCAPVFARDVAVVLHGQ